jgi:asparagine synthase (glutamine-hydrolysing)
MSGIVGIVNADGAPVSTDLLARMAAFLRFRGPDAENVWSDCEVGFGHALLDTSGWGAADKQPLSIDGKVWIVADARIDARTELAEKLQSSGITLPPGASDADLILRAYHAWGKDCLHHLIGDFAFAIWDGSCKQLFCARDHFGVKPFYYANLPRTLVFSNTLNCLRFHPDVSSRFNDLAICDYLLFGSNQDSCSTSFEQIQRLAPGHWLLCSGGKISVAKYWALPQPSELRYKKRQDYIENFRTLLEVAVQDRLPGGRVAICLSGGLDSSTVAAAASKLLGEKRKTRIQAYSVVYDRLIPDQERQFAAQVADFCGIPLQYLAADSYQLFQHWRDNGPETAEPSDEPLCAINRDLSSQMAVQSRVMLTGEGGDPCLVPCSAAIVKLLKTGRLWNFVAGYARCALWQRTVPRAGLRSLIRTRMKTEEKASLPDWINPDLAVKLGLLERQRKLALVPTPIQHHRSQAYNFLTNVWWANGFELCDPGNSPWPIEARHPFFDLRLVDFLLSLPTLPWCIGKQIIRESMAGFLPREILRRRKTPLAGDPVAELLKHPQTWVDSFRPTPELLHYVTPSRIPLVAAVSLSAQPWVDLRPLSLNHWLRMQAGVGYNERVK